MADREPFTLVPSEGAPALFPDYKDITSAKIADPDIQITAALRSKFPDLTLTIVSSFNAPLVQFAATGNAIAELETDTDPVLRWRGYIGPSHRGGQGQLGDAIFFAKYHYRWGSEDFILYTVGNMQYILKEPGPGEDYMSHCFLTDALITTVVKALSGDESKFIYVFDNYWSRSRELWEEVQKASWDKVILDEKMKHALQSVTQNFFDSRDVYRKYSVPWKRGLIYYGPAGNGKTISLKALMHTLYDRKESIPTLYVKSAPYTYHIRAVFEQARRMTPCLLVMEDIETIVTPQTRSYFFNEVDGLENNDGILMVASTNYLDRLDPGLSRRPSRFDRKYFFPLPNQHERTLYAQFWREKVKKRTQDSIAFPEKICSAIADITGGFSFAYMQEAFVATLLALARDSSDDEAGFEGAEDVGDLTTLRGGGEEDPHDDLNGYKLWRVIKTQVKSLRDDMGEENVAPGAASADGVFNCVDMAAAMPGPPVDPRRDLPAGPRESSAWKAAAMPTLEDIGLHRGGRSGVTAPREPTTGDLARHGVGKVQRLAETAWVWEPLQ